MKILLLLYDCLFIFGFIVYLPVYIWRKKTTLAALGQKIGLLKSITSREVIWIQVVSVGEANVIENLIRKIKQDYDIPILISTTTLTGNKIATKKYSDYAQVVFFPLDISIIVWHFIRIFRPKIFIAVETEIWPNLFTQLKAKGIPIVIINGRISDGAFKRYKLIRRLVKIIINKCDYIAVQNQMYKERFCCLGADKKKIVVSGNMKFESITINRQISEKVKQRYWPVLKPDKGLLLIAGCTHPGEEDILLDVYRDLLDSSVDLRFLIAPRHPERAASIEKLILAKDFEPFSISRIPDCNPQELKENKKAVFVLDTIGELLYFYALCDISFVGGSLSCDGGHNILEPIYLEKPTIFGPHMDNFLDVEEVVLEKGAGIKVSDNQQLRQTLMRLLEDQALRTNLSNRCRAVFQQERESLDKNLKIVLQSLKLATK